MCQPCRVAGNLLGIWTDLTPERLYTIRTAHSRCTYPTSCTCQHRDPTPGVEVRQQAVHDEHRTRRGL